MPAATGVRDSGMRMTLVVMVTLALGGCAMRQAAPEPTAAVVAAEKQVFVIRHLHKAPGDDPSLTPQGAAAAERLAEMLADEGIVAVFATPTRRAMETAAPLARRLGIAVTPYDPRRPDWLANAVASATGAVLVVGHSNTVPELVGRFGGTRPAPLSEEDYGTLFVVDGDREVVRLEVR